MKPHARFCDCLLCFLIFTLLANYCSKLVTGLASPAHKQLLCNRSVRRVQQSQLADLRLLLGVSACHARLLAHLHNPQCRSLPLVPRKGLVDYFPLFQKRPASHFEVQPSTLKKSCRLSCKNEPGWLVCASIITCMPPNEARKDQASQSKARGSTLQ